MRSRAACAWIVALSLVLAAPGRAQTRGPLEAPADSAATTPTGGEAAVRDIIGRHLGRPYVWGASGMRSFDCSGFVWRVMQESGIFVKRTTARKYYMTLPKVSDQGRWSFGNIVFFDQFKHCGIVESREAFYHAAVTEGTHRSNFAPYWRSKVSGVRAMPGRARPAAESPKH